MDPNRVPASLRDRLGPEATGGLLELLDIVRAEWTADMIHLVGDRFERRLVEETSMLRVEMAQGFAALRQEMARGLAAVRQEMAQEFAAVRQEMAQEFAAVGQEMAQGLAVVRQDVTGALVVQRVELLKWAFLFWIGQFFAMASLVALLIRLLRPHA
jgi:hypothetical protein